MEGCTKLTLIMMVILKAQKRVKKKSELHISLQINTDGVALFRSSTFSIWPVYYIINELPPNCRYGCS